MRKPRNKNELKNIQISGAVSTVHLQAELASSLARLLPLAERQARQGKPALLRLITRYATNRYLLPRSQR